MTISSFNHELEKAMEVSWKKERINNGANGSGFILVASLVECDQTAGGAGGNHGRQLSAIGEKFLRSKARDIRAFHQGLFWQHVDKKLSHLGIDPQEKEKIELTISKTVPKPDENWALWSVTCIPRIDP